MKTAGIHLQINVDAANFGFYRDLFTFLGWQILNDDEYVLGVGSGEDGAISVWFAKTTNTAANDYDGPGMNHLAVHAQSQADVDQTVDYLRQHGVECLFETPRHRPDFSSEGSTYYQVMFASPDNLLFEVVYMGPKQD